MSRQPRRGTVWLQWALAALALVTVSPRPSAAQFERSTVSGTVVDQQGAVVPGATITALEQSGESVRQTELACCTDGGAAPAG